MSGGLVCWRCGGPLADVPLPFSRRAECPACNADLHVCLMCTFYDERAAQDCREPVADEVKDKGRANFCGYFQPRHNAHRPAIGDEAARAKAELDALFGLGQGAGGEGPAPEEGAVADQGPDDEAQRARRELERLFDSPAAADDPDKGGKEG